MKGGGRRGVIISIGLVALVALAAACGGGGSSESPSPSAGESNYDVTISGALTAEWKSGSGDGSGISCGLVEDGRVEIGLYGQIDGKTYGMSLRQAAIANGQYTYPASPPPSGFASPVPFVQLGTTGDAAQTWTADSEGNGTGSAIVGGEGNQVTLDLDVELTASDGGSPVHVSGAVNCSS